MKRLIVAFIVSVFCVSATSNVQAEDGDGKVKGWTAHRTIVPYRAPSRPRWRNQYPPAAPQGDTRCLTVMLHVLILVAFTSYPIFI
jgi:hypothetical protein